MTKFIALLLPCILCACGSTDSKASAIRVGMPIGDAKTILEKANAKETVLAMKPAQRPDGSYLQLVCYELPNGTSLALSFDDSKQNEPIMTLARCYEASAPSKGEWKDVDEFQLP